MVAAGLAVLTLVLEVARRVSGGGGTWTDVALPLVILGALGTGAGPVRTRPGLQRWVAGVTLALATVLSAVVFGPRR